MQHVANDGHGQVGKVFLVVANGVHVEQTLGRVRVAAVTCVDHVHMRRDVLGDQVGRAGFAVAHHKNISRHGAQVGNGVKQRLALGRAGARNVQVNHVG